MTERFDRLQEIKTEIAALTGQPVESDAVIIPAAYKLKFEILIEDLVAGRSVNPIELLNLGQAVREFMPLPKAQVEINIVAMICPECDYPFW